MGDALAHTRSSAFAHPRKNVSMLGIVSGMRVADFGSGSGAYALSIAEEMNDSGRVYAIDIQKDLLRRLANESARLGRTNLDVIWADLEVPRASKLAEHSIDVVLMSNMLFQVHDKKRVIREALRVVKTNGRIAVIDWTDSFGGMGPTKDDILSRDAALALLQEEGAALVQEFSAGAHHYGLIFMPEQHTV